MSKFPPPCVICGKPTINFEDEQVTGEEFSVAVHPSCRDKAFRNHLYGLAVRVNENNQTENSMRTRV